MKLSNCAICGSKAEICFRESLSEGGGVSYGCFCKANIHFIEPIFDTEKAAVSAWNETQKFIEKYGNELL